MYRLLHHRPAAVGGATKVSVAVPACALRQLFSTTRAVNALPRRMAPPATVKPNAGVPASGVASPAFTSFKAAPKAKRVTAAATTGTGLSTGASITVTQPAAAVSTATPALAPPPPPPSPPTAPAASAPAAQPPRTRLKSLSSSGPATHTGATPRAGAATAKVTAPTSENEAASDSVSSTPAAAKVEGSALRMPSIYLKPVLFHTTHILVPANSSVLKLSSIQFARAPTHKNGVWTIVAIDTNTKGVIGTLSAASTPVLARLLDRQVIRIDATAIDTTAKAATATAATNDASSDDADSGRKSALALMPAASELPAGTIALPVRVTVFGAQRASHEIHTTLTFGLPAEAVQPLARESLETAMEVSARSKMRGESASVFANRARDEIGASARANHPHGKGPACQCGLEGSLSFVKKEGPNHGRPFWSCPRTAQKLKCKFFAWADDIPHSLTAPAPVATPASPPASVPQM